MPRQQTEETARKKRPDFVVRAKDANGYWHTIGAAWTARMKDHDGFSLKLNVVPMGWTGDAILVVPLEGDQN